MPWAIAFAPVALAEEPSAIEFVPVAWLATPAANASAPASLRRPNDTPSCCAVASTPTAMAS